MRLGFSLVAGLFISLALYAGLGTAPLTLPAFHDGQATPKTIATVVAHPHRVSSNLVGGL